MTDVNAGFKQFVSCRRLCINESFTTVDHISVMCCNLRYFTC